MNTTQRLQVRSSELREQLNALAGIEGDLTDEQCTEVEALSKDYHDVEVKLRAALTAEPEARDEVVEGDDPEQRDLARLRAAFSIGKLVEDVREDRASDGPEAELQQASGLGANYLPLSMLTPQPEERAIATISADTTSTEATIVPQVFPDSITSFLGIATPTVDVGVAAFPVVTTGATAETPAKGSAISESTAALTVPTLKPQAIGGALSYAREDSLLVRGMPAGLADNLRGTMASAFDNYVLNGSTVGLFTGTNIGKSPSTNPAAAQSWGDFKELLAVDRVDGLHASSESDLRILLGAATYQAMSGLYRTTTATDRDVVDELRGRTGGVRVSSLVPAAASNLQKNLVRVGQHMDAVAPIWEGVELIVENVTRAREREVNVTAVLYANFAVLRAAGFQKVNAYIA